MENIKDGKEPTFQHPFISIEDVKALLEEQNYVPEKEICIATKLSLDLKKGDYLWTSPITFVASAHCGLYCGAKIDFVDIDISTGLIDIKKLEQKLKIAEKEGKLPKVIIGLIRGPNLPKPVINLDPTIWSTSRL